MKLSLIEKSQFLVVKAGEYLFKQGEIGSLIFIVI